MKNISLNHRRYPFIQALHQFVSIIRNKIGAGADYASGRWKFSADVYDPNDLSVRLRGQYALTPNLFLTGQSIFPHNNRGGGEYIGVGYNY